MTASGELLLVRHTTGYVLGRWDLGAGTLVDEYPLPWFEFHFSDLVVGDAEVRLINHPFHGEDSTLHFVSFDGTSVSPSVALDTGGEPRWVRAMRWLDGAWVSLGGSGTLGPWLRRHVGDTTESTWQERGMDVLPSPDAGGFHDAILLDDGLLYVTYIDEANHGYLVTFPW